MFSRRGIIFDELFLLYLDTENGVDVGKRQIAGSDGGLVENVPRNAGILSFGDSFGYRRRGSICAIVPMLVKIVRRTTPF